MATRKRPRDVEEYDKFQGLVIYVGNVHYDADPINFEQFLQDCGISCTVYWPEAGERSHGGWCWARFDRHDHASYAINNLNGAIFCGRILRTGHVATNSVSFSSSDAFLKMQRASDSQWLN
jgi:RNA recognition motif-containing protein